MIPIVGFLMYLRDIYKGKSIIQIIMSLTYPLLNQQIENSLEGLQPYNFIYFIMLSLGVAMVHFNSIFRILLGYPITYIIIGVCLSNVSDNKRKWLIRTLIFYLVFQAFLFGSEAMPI